VLSTSTSIEDNYFNVVLRLPAGTTLNINPTLLCEKFFDEVNVPIENVHYTRQRILSANGEDFM
jgi:hypothetical protein